MSAEFWMRLQAQYELDVADDEIAADIRREVQPAPRDSKTGELKPAATA